MGWLDRVVQAFIMTFGITQPSAQGRRAANLFIGALLLLMILGLLAMIVFGVRQMIQ